MKKIILTIAIVLGIGFGVNAQSDAFFTQSFSEYRDADEEIVHRDNLVLMGVD